jgi:L-lactate dehydrogenase (cytochrome)/(S)-mandelate dehydrogenase
MRDIHSIDDLRRRAKRRLPAMVFDFIEGGALDELTLRRNREALEAQLLPLRVLVDT